MAVEGTALVQPQQFILQFIFPHLDGIEHDTEIATAGGHKYAVGIRPQRPAHFGGDINPPLSVQRIAVTAGK